VTRTVDSYLVYARDRLTNLGLLASAAIAWAAAGVLFTTRSPVDDPAAQMIGSVLLGIAVGLTLWPLFWLGAFASRHRIAHRGDWLRAGRRALLAGLAVTLLVVLRLLDTLSLPIAAFVVVMAGLVELSLTVRR
jgi:hypothetical protein